MLTGEVVTGDGEAEIERRFAVDSVEYVEARLLEALLAPWNLSCTDTVWDGEGQ